MPGVTTLQVGNVECKCAALHGPPRLVVITGGPGAGKTAVLEMILRSLCGHVAVLPEAAGIVFGGGFPRHTSEPGRRAAQRAIFHVQRQLERLAIEEGRIGVVLCDRGTLDGLAYWPGRPGELMADVGTTAEAELQRYRAVLHLRTPGADNGYNQRNPLRTESAIEAGLVDRRIADAWAHHPRRVFVDCAADFVVKATRAVELVRAELPDCCQRHLALPGQAGMTCEP